MSIVGVDWGGGGSSAPVPCDRFVGWFFEVCDMVQLLFLLSNYKIIYHDIIFCTNQSNHYKTSPLRVRYLQIYQQSHHVKIHFLTQVFWKLYLIILV